ncbi:type II secretion system protein [Aminirod propionatiphilus]|uniref:Type II secretion system protein n=1 Tax=Aminirod propionatiphilus TaxID=3415223 RepID=A0ACD1DYI7_9BACT|nr:type II secretion system protein [Synergistota bacterium]
MASRGFTLLEVLVAVAILALSATGALRLVAMSQRSLAEVRLQRDFLDGARALQVRALAGDLPSSGSEGDLAWEVRPVTRELLEGLWTAQYGLLRLQYKGRTMTLCIP